MKSSIIKRTLADNEEIKKYFSICGRYIRIKIFIVAFKYLFLISLFGVALFFAGRYGAISPEKVEQVWVLLGLAFLLIFLPIIIIYNNFYLKISNEFVFTDRRILVKRGWLSTNLKTIYYNRITDVSITQSLLERIIKTGTMSISTAGSDGYEAVLWHVSDPHKLKRELYNIKTEYQERFFRNRPQDIEDDFIE